MSDGLRYCRAPHVLWRRTLDTVVLLPVTAKADEEPFTLAGTGPEVWTLLREPRTLDDLVDRLATVHRAPPDRVVADVEPLLEQLLSRGAVVRA